MKGKPITQDVNYDVDGDDLLGNAAMGTVRLTQLVYARVDCESCNKGTVFQQNTGIQYPLYPAVIEDTFDYTPDCYVQWDQIGKEGYSCEIWNPASINNELDRMVFVRNDGITDVYARTFFAFEAGVYKTLKDYLHHIHLNLNENDWDWEWLEESVAIGEGNYYVAVATNKEVLRAGEISNISLIQVAMDSRVTNEQVFGFGDTFQILIRSQAVHADDSGDPSAALNKAFWD